MLIISFNIENFLKNPNYLLPVEKRNHNELEFTRSLSNNDFKVMDWQISRKKKKKKDC